MELLAEFAIRSFYITEDVVNAIHKISDLLANHQFPTHSIEDLAKGLVGLTIEVRRVSADANLSRNLLTRLDVQQTIELGIRVYNSATGKTKAEAEMLYKSYIRDLSAYKSNARGSEDLPDRVAYIANMYSSALGRIETKDQEGNRNV